MSNQELIHSINFEWSFANGKAVDNGYKGLLIPLIPTGWIRGEEYRRMSKDQLTRFIHHRCLAYPHLIDYDQDMMIREILFYFNSRESSLEVWTMN